MQSTLKQDVDSQDKDSREQGDRFDDNPLMQCALLGEQSFPNSTLYIVGLPIGNAADITLRALWILDKADVIACEDTRETRKLLDRYGIHTPTMSVHEHNERSAAEKLIERLKAGDRIALVTDAGTPAVSDPGAKAVHAVREAGLRVSPVPGCSAVITALSASGLDSYTFTFVGFVPPASKARKAALAKYAAREDAFVVYEAPHRIRELLADLADSISPERRVVVTRELTKKFETFEAMKGGELKEWAKNHEPRGEYAIAVDQEVKATAAFDDVTRTWLLAIAQEMPASRAAAMAAKVTGMKRDTVYQFLMENRPESD